MSFIPLTALVVHGFYTLKIWRREFYVIWFPLIGSHFTVSNGNKLVITPIVVLCLVELGESPSL
jgi:hypothetical protein